MSVSFKDLLSTPLDTVKRPPALPQGTYEGVVKAFEFGESREKKTPYVRVFFTLIAAGEDVDADLMNGVDLAKRAPRTDFYVTNDSMWRIKEFLASLGLDVEGRTLSEVIPEMVSANVQLYITQRSSADGQEIFNDVKSVKGVA